MLGPKEHPHLATDTRLYEIAVARVRTPIHQLLGHKPSALRSSGVSFAKAFDLGSSSALQGISPSNRIWPAAAPYLCLSSNIFRSFPAELHAALVTLGLIAPERVSPISAENTAAKSLSVLMPFRAISVDIGIGATALSSFFLLMLLVSKPQKMVFL